MSKAKIARTQTRQLGQYMTPPPVARQIVAGLELRPDDKALEPSFGDGSFIIALIDRFLALRGLAAADGLAIVMRENIFGIEIDPVKHGECLAAIARRYGCVPESHNLVNADFLARSFVAPWFDFNHIIGNPPFGGTIDVTIQDKLDRQFGWRNGLKIKKETYSFFIVKSLELLQPAGGRMTMICSDTFLTINTMRGLRELLMREGETEIEALDAEFVDVNHPMVVLSFVRSQASGVRAFGFPLPPEAIRSTGNLSWGISAEFAPLFAGAKVGDYLIASSGMTVGNNDLFVREVTDNQLSEPYEFRFYDDPITLRRELEKARLGFISPGRRAAIAVQEEAGTMRRNVRAVERDEQIRVTLPHPDYRPYNKATNTIVFCPPTHYIYWKDEGDAVITFKKNGNWYLHGVGGKPYFEREGITWQLISSKLNARYLPPGYILDSGAPCAFLRESTPRDELFFILGWFLTPLCTQILKQVINHTRNIQSKDIERLPYPFWVSPERKAEAIQLVRRLIEASLGGHNYDRADPELGVLAVLFAPTAPCVPGERLARQTGFAEDIMRSDYSVLHALATQGASQKATE